MRYIFYCNEDIKAKENGFYQGSIILMETLKKAGHDIKLFHDHDILICYKLWLSSQEHYCHINLHNYNCNGYLNIPNEFPYANEQVQLTSDAKPTAIFLKRDKPNIKLLEYLRREYETKDGLVINGTNVYETHNKAYCKKFLRFMPETIYSSSIRELEKAVHDFGTAILKPLDEGCGRGIRKVDKNTTNLEKILEEMTNHENTEIIAQRFQKDVNKGDKRIIVFTTGSYSDYIPICIRLPPNRSYLCNISAGGIRKPCNDITEKELEILEAISPVIAEDGVYVCGADFIGGRLTELNTMNPGFTMTEDEVRKKNFEKRFLQFMDKMTETMNSKKLKQKA